METAIIGISCKLPCAENYWAIGGYQPSWRDRFSVFSEFNYSFFGLTAERVKCMDCWQCAALELVWSCIEDAAILPASLYGRKIGVFIATINPIAVTANGVSHHYHFTGPSVDLDISESSSLQVMQVAVQALAQGDCEMAFVGGIDLLQHSAGHISFAETKRWSAADACKMADFDTGYVLPKECGTLLLLKSREAAQKDGDPIHGVVKHCIVHKAEDRVEHDESSVPSHTAAVAQNMSSMMVKKTRVSEGGFSKTEFITTSIYLRASMSLFGIVRLLLTMKSENMQRSESQPLLQTEISEQAFNGSGGHIVVEQAPSPPCAAEKKPDYYMICLSAKTPRALKEVRRNLLLWMENNQSAADLLNISATLLLGREHFSLREAYVVKDHTSLLQCLRDRSGKQGGAADEDKSAHYFVTSNLYEQIDTAEERNMQRDMAREILRDISVNIEPAGVYKLKVVSLARWYALGEDLDWRFLFFPFKRANLRWVSLQRLHMPVYPISYDRVAPKPYSGKCTQATPIGVY